MWTGRYAFVGAGFFTVAALCWGASGIYAIIGRRHMFGAFRSGPWGNIGVSPSERSPIVARIVGVILLVLAVGLVNAAVQIAFR
jgi:hypothetical protein